MRTTDPVTIPWPAEVVAQMADRGLGFLVGPELYERLAALPANRGWDFESSTWAGIPIDRSVALPPRALLVSRGRDRVSYIEDVDKPRAPAPDL